MIITDDFVMINFPKTGSSFARAAIKKLYSRRCSIGRKVLSSIGLCNPGYIELMLPNINNSTHKFRHRHAKGQHGHVSQIPEKYRDRPVVSIVRNPFSRYISGYQFKWWEKYPPQSDDVIFDKYPHFPNLSFEEFYNMKHEFGRENRLRGIEPKIELGIYSIQFIQFYCRHPAEVLNKIDDNYIEKELFREDMGNIKFLRQENLREDLKAFLLDMGVSSEEITFLDFMEKMNVTEKIQPGSSDDTHIDPEIKNKVLARDRLIFKIFPEYAD